MKKCSYCGRENPDEATQCSGCGMQEFSVGTPPQISAQERRSGRKKILLRLLTAGCVWVAVSGISLYVAWQQANHSMAWFEQEITQRKLVHIGQALTAYQKKFDSFPSSMDQLGIMTNEVPSIESDLDGNADGWKRPFVLSGTGTDMQVISYGSDGKLGGEGIDCDLTTVNPRPKESLPTFDRSYMASESKE